MKAKFNKTHKNCKKCGKWLPLEDFYPDKYSKSGKSTYCIKHSQERGRNNWYKPKTQDNMLRKLYGISLEEYSILREVQKDCCALCGMKKKLVVDHDHNTGRVRGLLCQGCNVTVGMIETYPSLAKKIKEYIK